MYHEFNNWSDHASLHVKLGEVNGIRGGLWCFNTSILEDEVFNRKIRKLLVNITEELDINNYIQKCNNIKIRTKNLH